MLSYEEAMVLGADRYRDVLDALTGAGLPAQFTQTGGMCAAIEVVLEGGWVLLITDAEDTLAWNRAVHRGWGVSLYRPDSDGGCPDNGPVIHRSTEDGSPRALVVLVASMLTVHSGGFNAEYQPRHPPEKD